MNCKTFIFVALLLFFGLAFAADQEKAHNETKQAVSTANENKGTNDVKPAVQVDLPNGYGGESGYFGHYGGFGGGSGGGGAPTGGGEQGGGEGSTGGAQGGGEGNTGGGGGDESGYRAGFSHGGAYGTGRKCYWGCCSESSGYSHGGGGYYNCKCCFSFAEAKAYREAQAKAQTKN